MVFLGKETQMRVSDDRYNRDRRRFDLAMRMLLREARTSTIHCWTGLSGDRIRKLYNAYLAGREGAPCRRMRGRASQRVDFFLCSPARVLEATTLASLYSMLGLLERPQGAELLTVERGMMFCQAYETYRSIHGDSAITFESASYLLMLLLRGEELSLGRCEPCGRMYLKDLLARQDIGCPHCRRNGKGATDSPRTLVLH